MDIEDQKKYNIFENILQKVNQKYIALPDDETKRNNKLLLIVDKIIQKMRSKNTLFGNLYQTKYYGGSYYDNLKVGKPNEYDLDCLLCLPKIVQPTVIASDKPGYVHVVLNMKGLNKKVDEAPKYVGLEKLIQCDRLSTKKVKSWMEGLLDTVLPKTSQMNITMDDSEYTVRATCSKSGPALTIKLEGIFDGNSFNIDVDLVPCFVFTDQWPEENYRKNPSQTKNTFFVVPKSPNEDATSYWRLSFQEQEKELISGAAVMKPTIRLIKKIRDRYQHKIASYFIKTVFLWELENVDKNLWTKSLSFVFMMMLRKYAQYVSNKRIPYYWNDRYNLIDDLPDITAACIANKLKNIADEIDRNCLTSPYNIIFYFLSSSEVDIDVFKQEVPLSKKQLKLLTSTRSPPRENVVSEASFLEPSLACTPSSSTSSFEEITKDTINQVSVMELFSKIEVLSQTLISEQKRIASLVETILEALNQCQTQIQQLRDELEVKKANEAHEVTKFVEKIFDADLS